MKKRLSKEDIKLNRTWKRLVTINLILLFILFILFFLELFSPAYYILKVGILWEKILKKPGKAVIRYKRLIKKYPDSECAEKAGERIKNILEKK